jgi:hypothetical protein
MVKINNDKKTLNLRQVTSTRCVNADHPGSRLSPPDGNSALSNKCQNKQNKKNDKEVIKYGKKKNVYTTIS